MKQQALVRDRQLVMRALTHLEESGQKLTQRYLNHRDTVSEIRRLARRILEDEHGYIRDMRTKWGSCNSSKGIIWLNTELSAKPTNATDYVILHEIAHLISDRHDDQFIAILDQHMPQWRTVRNDLNSFPLSAWDDYTWV